MEEAIADAPNAGPLLVERSEGTGFRHSQVFLV